MTARVCPALLFAAACLPLGAIPAPDDASKRLREEYLSTRAALAAHCDGFAIDDSPEAPVLLDREWSLTAEWVALFLNEHPAARSEEINAAVLKLDARLESSVIEIAEKTFVVASRQGEIGTFFIVAGAGERFEVLWHVKDEEEGGAGDDAGVSHWVARNVRSGGHGPLYPRLGKLPHDEKGNARFYVDAGYAQYAGATIGGQISVWRWDGAEATPLLVKEYRYMIDTKDAGVVFDGDVLRVHTKEEFKTFFSCGGCNEPDVEWRFRITPQGVLDLGKRRLEPELDAIDELYYRIQRGIPAEDLAAPAVIEELTDVIEDIRNKQDVTDDYAPLGMLGDWEVRREAERTKLCLSTDDVGRYLFTLLAAPEKLFVLNVQNVNNVRYGKSCAEALANAASAAPAGAGSL